jgi:hypothetical protein
MSEKQPYEHSGKVMGSGADSPTPETEHRDTARPTDQERNELNPEQRNKEKAYGPRTHQDTRIDPDPRFEEEER